MLEELDRKVDINRGGRREDGRVGRKKSKGENGEESEKKINKKMEKKR